MKFTLICNPENRRAEFFCAACRSLQLPAPDEVAWEDLLRADTIPDFSADAIRIESPGENSAVEQLLIAKGGGPLDLLEDRGRIRCQPLWYAGWHRALNEISESNRETRFMNAPTEIALMFDKPSAQQAMRERGIPVPDLICDEVTSWDQLRHSMEQQKVSRVFVKTAHGSSASGVVALQTGKNGRILATAPVELVRDETTGDSAAYNTLRIQNYQNEQGITDLIAALAPQRIFAEQWFPKAALNGRIFDLRVVVIAGEARHIVVRTSQGPITNLHLGNARGDADEVRTRLGDAKWREAMEICENAAAVFPGSHTVAVDLMVGTNFSSFAVAEVNAFGDLLPNVLSRGDDTYTASLRGFLK